MSACKDTIAGKAMSQWWDVSDEAGPSRRPEAKFEEAPPSLEVLTVSDGELKSFGNI